MRRLAPTGVLLAVVCSLLLIPSGTATARVGAGADIATKAAAARRVATEYAFGASGFGTRIRGGDIPVASGDTAWRATGCTNAAGIEKGNSTAAVTIPGLGTINGLQTRVWTTKRGQRYASHASHQIANITLVETAIGSLALSGIKTTAHAIHTPTGYHTRTTAEVLKLVLTPPVGDPIELPIPAPGDVINVPGVPLRISMGAIHERAGARSAQARASGLLINLTATNTVVRVASSRARIAEGVRKGLFSGHSAGISANALNVGQDSIVKVGRTPLLTMPCEGTDGAVVERPTAGIDIQGALVVGAVTTRQRGQQTERGGRGFEEAKIASVNLGGQIQIDGITARANVIRKGRKVIRNVKGTSTLAITVNGEPQTLPPIGVLEIPGVVKIEEKVVERTRNSISVIALRLTLLDGTGAVVNIGEAKMKIVRAVH